MNLLTRTKCNKTRTATTTEHLKYLPLGALPAIIIIIITTIIIIIIVITIIIIIIIVVVAISLRAVLLFQCHDILLLILLHHTELPILEASNQSPIMSNTFSCTHKSRITTFMQLVSSDGSFRMLLWHGSRLTNWVGILSQGLRIAPPEAPVTGYMVS